MKHPLSSTEGGNDIYKMVWLYRNTGLHRLFIPLSNLLLYEKIPYSIFIQKFFRIFLLNQSRKYERIKKHRFHFIITNNKIQ